MEAWLTALEDATAKRNGPFAWDKNETKLVETPVEIRTLAIKVIES